MPDYRLELLDGELLLYHLAETKIMYLNQVASLIWQLCDGERTVEEITAMLCEAFPESAEAVASDVIMALEQLLEHGAIRFR
jgi:coenzyme PQQ biosynthesis protein PqqD